MKYHTTEDTLTYWLEGRIDVGNVTYVERNIERAIEQSHATHVCFDASGLDYISSAGLRMIMQLLKSGRDVSLVGASPSIYSAFQITGLTTLMEVCHAPQ